MFQCVWPLHKWHVNLVSTIYVVISMYLEWKQNEHLNFMFILAIRYFIYLFFIKRNGLPSGSDGKESACNVGDLGSIPGSGRSPGEGNGYPLQYSCLRNSMHRLALVGYSPWGHKELDTKKWLTISLFT